MKSKIFISLTLAALCAAGSVETVHNEFYEGRYDYMASVFDRVSMPLAWFPNRIMSKESQANMAALYAMSEVANSRPFETNKPSTQAYSFTSAGKYEPLKQRDLTAIAGRVQSLAGQYIDFSHTAGSFAFTPWCFNPLGAEVFAYINPAGSYSKITAASGRTYTGANVGLGGLDFSWGNIFTNMPAPVHHRAVARNFVSLCTINYMGVTNITYDTSAAPTDIVDMYRWTQSHTTDIAPWESTMTMQNAWLWNVAPIIAAHNTVFWYAANSIYTTTWKTRERRIGAYLDAERIDIAINNYMQEHSDPDEWQTLTIDDCVVEQVSDTGELTSETANMSWEMECSFSSEGGWGISLKGKGAEKEIGTVTPYALTNSASEWTFTGIEAKAPSTVTNSATYSAQVYTIAISSPAEFTEVSYSGDDKGGVGEYYYYYNIPSEIGLSVSETPFGSIRDSYWADKNMTEKSCHTVLFMARQDPATNVYAGTATSTGSFFYNTLRGFSAPNDIATAGLRMRYEMPSEEPTWSTSVTVDLSQWERSGETDALVAFYFLDVEGEEVLDIYRVYGGTMFLVKNNNLKLSVGGRTMFADWATNFEDLKPYKRVDRDIYSINMFGAIVAPGLLQLK